MIICVWDSAWFIYLFVFFFYILFIGFYISLCWHSSVALYEYASNISTIHFESWNPTRFLLRFDAFLVMKKREKMNRYRSLHCMMDYSRATFICLHHIIIFTHSTPFNIIFQNFCSFRLTPLHSTVNDWFFKKMCSQLHLLSSRMKNGGNANAIIKIFRYSTSTILKMQYRSNLVNF